MSTMSTLRDKVTEKILDILLETMVIAAIGDLPSNVIAWCRNQAGIPEMRRKFEELLRWVQSVSDATNLRVQQLLRQLEDEARQGGKELLEGEPTTLKLSNAKERFERILVIGLELNDLLPVNGRVSSPLLYSVQLKVKGPQYKPRFLHRRTRFQVISAVENPQPSRFKIQEREVGTN